MRRLIVIVGRDRFSENDMEILQNVEKVLLADTTGISEEVLKDVSRFYELDHDNLKAEVRIFSILAEQMEKKDEISSLLGQDDKIYKSVEQFLPKIGEYRLFYHFYLP